MLVVVPFTKDLTVLNQYKAFMRSLRTALTPSQVGFIVGLSHMEACESLTTRGCKQRFSDAIDVSLDNIVALERTKWREGHSHHPREGLDGTISEEIQQTQTHLEPNTLLELVRALKGGSRGFYEHHVSKD